MNTNFVFIPGQGGNNTSLRHVEAQIAEDVPARPVLRPGIKNVISDETPLPEAVSAPEVPEEEQPLNAQEQLLLRKEIIREYDALRQQYISEGEKARFDAQEWAQRLIETTENDIRKLYAKNEKDCAALRKNAEEEGFKEGFDRGFSEGNEKGYEEGYGKALRKCKDTLEELMKALNFIDRERERYFIEYESKLFDTIFTIANKITVDSLKQKDKAVITKMLKEAAKGFRNSEYVKVTLSKLDTEQFATTSLDILKEAFRDNQHIEFEIVKDAPSGTLILDNGSEITDAGVATQLMMIEKLGKGKFRDKSEDDV